MAKFRVRVEGAHRISVPSADLDVNKNGEVVFGRIRRDKRAQVEAELRSSGLVDEDVNAPDESSDDLERHAADLEARAAEARAAVEELRGDAPEKKDSDAEQDAPEVTE